MKLNYKAAVLTGAIALLGIQTNAQEKQNPVPEPLKKLYVFEGNWQGKATMTVNGQTMTMDYFMDMKKDAQGWGLSYHEKGMMPDAPPYIGFGAFGMDMADNSLHIYTISNYGDVHDHKGTWTDDKNFKLQYTGNMDGKPMVEDLWCEVIDKDRWKLHDKITVGGEVFQTMEATMHRKKK